MSIFGFLGHAGHTPDNILHAIWHAVEGLDPLLLTALVATVPVLIFVAWRLRRTR